MNRYVYRLDDPITKEFYFGSRSCLCNIIDDVYMGSYKTWNPEDKSRLIKTILKSNFRKQETCIQYEASLIKENIDNPLNRNYYIPNKGFHTQGRKRTKLELERLSQIHKGKTISNKTREKISVNNGRGMLGKLHSKEAREKMSKNATGRIVSIETRNKLSEIRSGENHWNYGGISPNIKSVLQFTRDNIFIKEWNYMALAGETLGINKYNIGRCCRGELKTCGGFSWKYNIKTR